MAIAIRDTAPIQGEQAEDLFDLFYGEDAAKGKIRLDRLDATLLPEALEAIRRLKTQDRWFSFRRFSPAMPRNIFAWNDLVIHHPDQTAPHPASRGVSRPKRQGSRGRSDSEGVLLASGPCGPMGEPGREARRA
ncbi:MAG TPA: hypothetical protein VN931_10535 [Fibrobacteria bacterium]|nr:hypothetical protein [Fibrobacteria bacterium]